ncbi:LUD domain-containing protein [Clostridioides difficile]|uniref:LUD domain-containing protein n=1 Tax=Clostridioides sp. ZZV14-6154 TaxID=2811495 RepID=UPI002714D452
MHSPKTIIIIAGMSKVVDDVQSAIGRIRTFTCSALALNGKRKAPLEKTTHY